MLSEVAEGCEIVAEPRHAAAAQRVYEQVRNGRRFGAKSNLIANEVLDAAKEVAALSENLHAQVDSFLKQIRAG